MRAYVIIGFVWIFSSFNGFTQNENIYESLWMTNFKTAQDSSVKSKKAMLIYFSGSDWCKPCIKLYNEILLTKEFMDFATGSFILVHADFPYHKKLPKDLQQQNDNLAEKYNPEGSFPKLVIVLPNGKMKYSLGYSNVTPKQYIEMIKSNTF